MNLSQIRLYLISKNISVEKTDEIINDISKEVVKEFAEKVMADFDSNEEELDYNRCLLSVVNKLLKEYEEIK